MLYDGFISYSHAREAAVARALQSGLHRFARPWYRIRALRLFRDVTNLSANPGLWSAIEKALGEARYFLLLASPQSAASPWVQREVEWWLRHRPGGHLLLVLVDGSIRWDDTVGDFDWSATNVLPRGLAGAFREEPLYLDLRGFTSPEELSLTHPVFSDRIASLAATLHGRPKDEMIGEDVRQHRRAMRVAWSAAGALAVLAVTAAAAAFVAVHQRNVAEEQRRVAEERRKLAVARELVARGELLLGDRPDLHPAGLLLAAEGLRRLAAIGAPTWEADQALRRSLALSPEPVAVFEHDEPVISFALSPDGSRIAAGTKHGFVRMWTVGQDGQPLNFTHGDWVAGVAFSPDGTLLASGSWDGTAIVADVERRAIVRSFQHRAPVWGLAFSPDGRTLLTAGRGSPARVWDLRSGQERATLQHDSPVVASVQFSGDGRFIVLQGLNGTAYLFDAATMKPLGQAPHPYDKLDAAVLSSDGRRMATRSQHETFLYDIETGKQVARIGRRSNAQGEIWVGGRSESADAVAFSADSRWLYNANNDRTASIIDASRGVEARIIPHDGPVEGVAASADGKLLATRSGSVARLWDAASGAETGRLNHESMVSRMAFSGSRGLVATVAGAQIRLWREATGNPILSLPHVRGVWERLFSSDGRWLVTQDPHQVVSVWEAATGRRVAQLRHPDLIRNARFSGDGNLIATACNDRNARIWELPSGRLLAQFVTPLLPGSLSFSHGGTLLAVAANGDQPGDNGMVLAWEWKSARQILRYDTKKECHGVGFAPGDRLLAYSDAQPSLHLRSLAEDGKALVLDGFSTPGEPFSHDGQSLIAWRDRTVGVIDVTTGKLRVSIDLDRKVKSAELAPKSDTVAIIADDGSVRLWSTVKGGRVIGLPHELAVNSVRFSPDGLWLATGSGHPISGRGEARVWGVRDGALNLLQPHDRGVWVVDFSPDGERIATLARDLPTRIWISSSSALRAEANARATRNLTYAEWQQLLPDEPYPLLCDRQPVHPSVAAAAAKLLLDGDEAGGMRLFERIVALRRGRAPPGSVTLREEAARALIARSLDIAKEGDIPRALQAVNRAQELSRDTAIPAATWNLLAWNGSTQGRAKEVLFAAERAVELEPQNLNYRDTRGLARALTGNVPGAIEDFKAFVAGAAGTYPAKMVERRHLWLAGLVLDKNPFSEDVLRTLRDE